MNEPNNNEFTPDSNFDGGNYKPDMGSGRQKVHSFSTLGHRVHPDLMAATEAKRHGLGWQRLIGELVDIQHDLSPSKAYDSLKIVCNSYAFMMVAMSRCPQEMLEEIIRQNGAGLSLDIVIRTDYQQFKIGEMIRKVAVKAGVDEAVANAWTTMDEVDKFMQSAVRPKKKVEERSTGNLTEFLDSFKESVRLSFVMGDGSIVSGWLKRNGDGFGVLKRSDSTIIYPVDLARVKLVQSTTHPVKILFSSGA